MRMPGNATWEPNSDSCPLQGAWPHKCNSELLKSRVHTNPPGSQSCGCFLSARVL